MIPDNECKIGISSIWRIYLDLYIAQLNAKAYLKELPKESTVYAFVGLKISLRELLMSIVGAFK